MASLSATFTERLETVARALEPLLQALLGDAPLAGEIARPPRLVAAMRHAVLAGGKRLRPFLTVETARLLGADGEAPLRVGAAIELLHCYSLVHDDLPAMDDDDLRRGRPTVHRAFDEATAILAGDALLTLAFDVLADPALTDDASVRAELVLGLARAAGLGGMVGGQMLDLEAESRTQPLAEAEVRRLQAMKTGALIAFAVDAGGIMAGAGAEERRMLTTYGRALGAAFQIADDILDREASTDALGKRTAKDADRGKATLVDVLGLEAARAERDRLAEEAVAALAPFGAAADTLREAARFAAVRRK